MAGDALASYLRSRATEFLRALRLHREAGGPGPANGSEGSADAARALRRAARRISGSLHTFQAHLDAGWVESMRPELAWVSGTLALEHTYASRLERLLHALHRLSGTDVLPRQGGAAGSGGPHPHPAAGPERGSLTVGAAKAGALLERRLTLARSRAHSTALQALGSSRFHAVADRVAVLAGEVPLAGAVASAALRASAEAAEERLAAAVEALPLTTAGSPYNSEALVHGLSPDPAPHPQDAPWHQVRLLLRLHRYAREVLHGADGTPGGPGEYGEHGGPGEHGAYDTHDAYDGSAPADLPEAPGIRLAAAGRALDLHRDASEAAAAAAHAARTPRITPATAYALGVLHADQRHEVEAARYAFQRCWRREQSVSAR
ncbi:CHAD domain-containing protein [Streptomyces sp. NPDC005925]|uniref:CHAD domain-containing protein n=1 Tax=Streptomyces sp. NPDC005925 TaxID=3157172 RepID=UPI003407D4FD